MNLIVFPGEKLNLYIFEPRYKQLINECVKEEKTFGIPAVVEREISAVLTEVEVLSVDKEFPGGEMNITTQGRRRAHLVSFDGKAPDKLYPGGEIEWLEDGREQGSYLALKKRIFSYLQDLHAALGISREIVEKPEEITAFALGHHIGFNIKQKVHLLTLDAEKERLDYIKSHLEGIIPVVRETEKLKAKAKMNGHFKNVIPPDF